MNTTVRLALLSLPLHEQAFGDPHVRRYGEAGTQELVTCNRCVSWLVVGLFSDSAALRVLMQFMGTQKTSFPSIHFQ